MVARLVARPSAITYCRRTPSGTFFREDFVMKVFAAILPLPLIQEEQLSIEWQKNVHLVLVKCLREVCPGTVWLG